MNKLIKKLDEAKHKQGVVDYYNNAKNVWGETFKADYLVEGFRFYPTVEEHLNEIIKRIGFKGDETILDCGCGFGYMLDFFKKKYPKLNCYGVTLSDYQYSHAKKNYNGINFYKCDYNYTHFKNGMFDKIIFIESFGHSFSKHKTVSEVNRLLKIGGEVYIIDICEDSGYFDDAAPLSSDEDIKRCQRFYDLYKYSANSTEDIIKSFSDNFDLIFYNKQIKNYRYHLVDATIDTDRSCCFYKGSFKLTNFGKIHMTEELGRMENPKFKFTNSDFKFKKLR